LACCSVAVAPSPGSLYVWNPNMKLAPIVAVELSDALVAWTDLRVHDSCMSSFGVGHVCITCASPPIAGKRLKHTFSLLKVSNFLITSESDFKYLRLNRVFSTFSGKSSAVIP